MAISFRAKQHLTSLLLTKAMLASNAALSLTVLHSSHTMHGSFFFLDATTASLARLLFAG